MNRRSLSQGLVLLVSVPLALSSCGPTPPRELRDIGAVLDNMADKEAEFGTMSVSAPILSDPSNVFNFNPTVTSDDFYRDAKNDIQGRASEFQQEVTSLGLGANVSIDPTMAAAYIAQLQQYQLAVMQNASAQARLDQQKSLIGNAAQQQFMQSLATAQKASPTSQPSMVSDAIAQFQTQTKGLIGPTTLPSFPTAGVPTTAPSNLVSPPTDQIAQFATAGPGGKVFAAFQQLAGNSAPLSLSDRTALITAAGDTAVKGMFEIMGKPQFSQAFHNKRVLFGVCTVSVNPGWRTKKNYAANVSMNCHYGWRLARATIVSSFIRNPQILAEIRIRLAIDQNMPLPKDKAALVAVGGIADGLLAATPANPDATLLKNWSEGSETTVLNASALATLGHTFPNPAIPLAYQNPGPDFAKGPLVAAVSPLTDVQTLDLSSSYRREREIALKLALQLQYAGANAQAQAFLNYANNLQQDSSTLTANVVANSYSTGSMFGFQVGPQLKAIEQARKGNYSGPADVLDRQSFPALVIFGFDASDLVPRVQVDCGKYELKEPCVKLLSAHNWVPIQSGLFCCPPQFKESDRLQMLYSLGLHSDWLKKTEPGMQELVADRTETLGQEFFGSKFDFSLPEEVISPPLTPQVLAIEPSTIKLPEPSGGLAAKSDSVVVPMVLEGTNLDQVDINRLRLVSGGRLLVTAEEHAKGDAMLMESAPASQAPRLIGNAIALKVRIDLTDDPKPLVFALPGIFGGGIYTKPIIPNSGSTPNVSLIAPRLIALDADTTGNPKPADVSLAIVGHHLDLIDWAGIQLTDQSDPPIATWSLDKPSSPHETRAIILKLHVTEPAESLAFKLPRIDGGAPIFTPPIMVTKNKLSLKFKTQSASETDTRSKNSTGDTTTPETAKPDVAKPDAVKPDVIKPAGTQPATRPTDASNPEEPAPKPAKPVQPPRAIGITPSLSESTSKTGGNPAKPTKQTAHTVNRADSSSVLEYSPGVSDAAIHDFLSATTKPSAPSSEKPASPSNSGANAVELQFDLKLAPATQPAAASSAKNK